MKEQEFSQFKLNRDGKMKGEKVIRVKIKTKKVISESL